MRHTFRSFFILLSICTCSCSTTSKLPPVETAEQIIGQHAQMKDPFILWEDIERFPANRDIIQTLLFRSLDYDNISYGGLKRLSMLAKDDFNASVFFDSLLIDRQTETLERLSNLSVKGVGEFYRKNGKEHDYLRDELKDLYLENLNEYDYLALKDLHNAFVETDLSETIDQAYFPLRSTMLKAIFDDFELYFEAEDLLLTDVEYNIRETLDGYASDGVKKVIADLSEKVDRGLFKKVFKREDMDQYTISEYASMLISKYLDPEPISDFVAKEISEYISTIYEQREEYISHYFDDADTCSLYYISPELIKEGTLSINDDNENFSDIQRLKTINGLISAASVALSFTPAAAYTIPLDLLDLYNGIKEESKISIMMKDATKSLYASYTDAIDNYINEIISAISQSNKVSRYYIIQKFNEDF